MALFEDVTRGAVFSDCKQYRYELFRIWDSTLPKVLFIMLNPSDADAKEDDPTIRRCINFAKSWGFGGLRVGNIFPYISSNPDVLKSVQDFHHEVNRLHLARMAQDAAIIVYGYGNSPIATNAIPLIERENTYCLKINKSGTPQHPLYVKGDTKPIPFNPVS